MTDNVELVDYDDSAQEDIHSQTERKEIKTGSNAYHSSAFRDFLLKPELLHAISDCGFEHPSPVQQQCIPQAMIGMDVIGQAKSGTGKTAVFVLSVLHQITAQPGVVDTLILCHTRELAFQITQEFERFGKYLPDIKTKCFFGGLPVHEQKRLLVQDAPTIVVGTPGRILELVRSKALDLSKLKRFVMDECDHLLMSLDMRKDVQSIFRASPLEKQVMLFSATLPADIRVVAKRFTAHPIEVLVDDGSLLTLHGLRQYYVKVTEDRKNRTLSDLLDALEFNQVVIFVNSVARCRQLNALLNECNFPSLAFHGSLSQEERIATYTRFKEYSSRILVSTDIFGRGVDFERVNVVINYDMPNKPEPYLHRVGRSGRFETKGLAISFISSTEDVHVMNAIQGAFEVQVDPLPDEIDTATYM